MAGQKYVGFSTGSAPSVLVRIVPRETNDKPEQAGPRVIEYSDMTDEQKAIVDAGLRPAAGRVPAHLTGPALLAWVREQAGLSS